MLAVLLKRPHEANRKQYTETINDADGLIVNTWRAIQKAPDEVAFHASNPVIEADLHARNLALARWRHSGELEHLMGDPDFYDPKMAGWWLWVQASLISLNAGIGDGPWTTDAEGRLFKQKRGSREAGINRAVPFIGGVGRGVNSVSLKEPGVSRERLHLGNNGQGVNTADLREPGVTRGLPHLGNNGQGINHPDLRELGTDYHDVVMPTLTEWMRHLSARLRHVRIINGDWKRAVTDGATMLHSIRYSEGKQIAGIFLDPPYSNEVRGAGLYAHDDGDVTREVLDWCLKNGSDVRKRIVLAGFDTEYEPLLEEGWISVESFKGGFMTGGMGNTNKKSGHQMNRDRLWLSPHCNRPE